MEAATLRWDLPLLPSTLEALSTGVTTPFLDDPLALARVWFGSSSSTAIWRVPT